MTNRGFHSVDSYGILDIIIPIIYLAQNLISYRFIGLLCISLGVLDMKNLETHC